MKGSVENRDSAETARKQMADKLNNDADLCEQLIPKWELGCRRVTPGQGYLESFLLPNVSLTQSPIKRITKNAIITESGDEQEFDVSKFSPLPSWSKYPEALLTRTQLFVLPALMSHIVHDTR